MAQLEGSPSSKPRAGKPPPSGELDVREVAALIVKVQPADVKRLRADIAAGIEAEVYKSAGPDRQRLSRLIGSLRVLEDAERSRHVDRARDAEIGRLTKLADTVLDRDQAKTYRDRAERLRDANPSPDEVVELRKAAGTLRSKADRLSDREQQIGVLRAAEAGEARADELEHLLKAAGVTVGGDTVDDALFKSATAKVAGLHSRIDSLITAHGGRAYPLETATLNKSADPIGRWEALSLDYRSLTVRVDELERTPMATGPVRMLSTVSKALGSDDTADTRIADYRRLAKTVTARDQAQAYEQLADDLEARNQQKGQH